MTYPSFSVGEVLTAADMNAVGLWRVVPTGATNGTVGTDGAVTVGNAVTSVTVSGAFSSAYRNYRIIVSGGTSSTGANLALTLGTANTGYYSSIVYTLFATSVVGGIGSNNAANFPYAGIARTNWSHMNLDVLNPQRAERTTIGGPFINIDATGSVGGFLDNTTAYTAFTLTPNSGTITGQRITIYGYNN